MPIWNDCSGHTFVNRLWGAKNRNRDGGYYNCQMGDDGHIESGKWWQDYVYVCMYTYTYIYNIIVRLLSHPTLVTLWNAACPASLSFTISLGLPKFMSIEAVMPSNHLILCRPFSYCLQSFPASGSFPMSWLFTSLQCGKRQITAEDVLCREWACEFYKPPWDASL